MPTERNVRIEPGFVAGSAGKLFTIVYGPVEGAFVCGALLVVPPFAEEMNRVRRSLALIARELAHAGYVTVLPDLYGTGDSEGSFGDARWEIWHQDLAAATARLRAHRIEISHVLAVRAGALLAFDAMRRESLKPRRLIVWNPATEGRRAIDQFLRLRVAADMANPSPARTSVEQLRGKLASGASVEISGYELHPLLAEAFDQQRVEAFASNAALTWFEISASVAGLSAGAERTVSAFRTAGWPVDARAIPGAPVWSTPETTVNDALNAETVRAVVNAG